MLGRRASDQGTGTAASSGPAGPRTAHPTPRPVRRPLSAASARPDAGGGARSGRAVRARPRGAAAALARPAGRRAAPGPVRRGVPRQARLARNRQVEYNSGAATESACQATPRLSFPIPRPSFSMKRSAAEPGTRKKRMTDSFTAHGRLTSQAHMPGPNRTATAGPPARRLALCLDQEALRPPPGTQGAHAGRVQRAKAAAMMTESRRKRHSGWHVPWAPGLGSWRPGWWRQVARRPEARRPTA